MPIQEYFDTKKRAKMLEDTLLLEIREAFDAGYRSLTTKVGNDNLLDMDKLKNGTFRKQFEDTAMEYLTDKAQRYLTAPPADPIDKLFKENRLMKGYAGFSRLELNSVLEQGKENSTFDNLMKALRRNIGVVTDDISATPLGMINPGTDAFLIPGYVGLTGKIDERKLAGSKVEELAQLLDAYEQFGVVPPKLYEDKPYKI
jgi:hypothetical protein